MKKIWFLIILTCVLYGAFSADCSNLLFFEGIGTPFTNGKNTNQMSFKEQVDHIRKNHGTNDMVLVGHSQGGVRALAYASMYPNETAAVITIGSPVLGHPLVTNINVTVAAVNLFYKAIEGGVEDAIIILDFLVANKDKITDEKILKLLNIYSDAKTFCETSTNGKTFVDMVKNKASYPGIEEMNPLGSFFMNNINPGLATVQHTIDVPGIVMVAQTKKILSGYNIRTVIAYYNTIRIFGKTIRIPVYKTISTPVYKYITVYVPQATTNKVTVETIEYQKRIKGAYTAFIVGTNNNLLSLADTEEEEEANTEEYHEKVGYLNTAAQIERAIAAGNLYGANGDIKSKVASMFTSAEWLTKAISVETAVSLLEQCDELFAKYLGGAGDCVIPVASQSRNIDLLGGTKLLNGRYTCYANHEQEMTHTEIWGPSGSLATATVDGGYLKLLLDELADKGKIDGLAAQASVYRSSNGAPARGK